MFAFFYCVLYTRQEKLAYSYDNIINYKIYNYINEQL